MAQTEDTTAATKAGLETLQAKASRLCREVALLANSAASATDRGLYDVARSKLDMIEEATRAAEQAVIAAANPSPDWRALMLEAMPFNYIGQRGVHVSTLDQRVGGRDARYHAVAWGLRRELEREGIIKQKGQGRNYVRLK